MACHEWVYTHFWEILYIDIAIILAILHNLNLITITELFLQLKWFLPSFSDIMNEEISAEEQESIEQNKQQLDSFLGVYPYDR